MGAIVCLHKSLKHINHSLLDVIIVVHVLVLVVIAIVVINCHLLVVVVIAIVVVVITIVVTNCHCTCFTRRAWIVEAASNHGTHCNVKGIRKYM